MARAYLFGGPASFGPLLAQSAEKGKAHATDFRPISDRRKITVPVVPTSTAPTSAPVLLPFLHVLGLLSQLAVFFVWSSLSHRSNQLGLFGRSSRLHMASSSSVSYAYIRLLQCLYIAQRVQIQFAGLWSSKKCGNLLYRGIKMRCELALMLIVPMVFDMLSQYGINQLRSADRHSYEAPSNLLLPCPDTTTAIMVQTYCNILKKYFCMIRY